MLGQVPETRLALIERIAGAARRRAGARNAERAARFVRAYYRGVADEDLAAREPGDLAAAALAHLEFGVKRPPNSARVRVFNPDAGDDGFRSPHTVVVLITDDMPFLVDSLGIVFGEMAVAVHLIVHPVLAMQRDARGRMVDVKTQGDETTQPESWQLYEIDRQIDFNRIAELERRLQSALVDVRAAVADFPQMRQRGRALVSELASKPPPLRAAEVDEARALLDWMEGRHFVFLGYRHYRLERGRSEDRLIPDARSGLGILRAGHGKVPRPLPTVLRGELRKRAREPNLLILTKANSIATVHRATYLDYIGVKEFDARGQVIGEHRFIGLWTSTAYHRSPRDIPVLREKVARVVDHFGLDPQSHDAKAVISVLESHPRDELFQASVDDLIYIVRGVVNLYERRTVRLLLRRDPYQRFYSCLIYVPRDRYSTDVRERIEHIIRTAFKGRSIETQVQISESSHARLHVVVRTDPAERQKVDVKAIEAAIALAATSWLDRLGAALALQRGEAAALTLTARYGESFPLAYQEDVAPEAALEDIADLEALRDDAQGLRLNLHRPSGQTEGRAHLKIVKRGDPISISDVLPMLENFGLRVIAERPYEIVWPEGGAAWVQDLELEARDGMHIDIPRIEPLFKEGFAAAWRGSVENDGFNRLVLGARLSARQIVVLRAYCRYLQQTGIPFSQAYMERTLSKHAPIARQLLQLFETQFDPARRAKARAADAGKIIAAVRSGLNSVTSLDEDRILRAYLTVIHATLRTSFYQRDAEGRTKPYLSFKLDPEAIPDLPLPRPKFEIFVYSPRVEGVHLRKGYVARGGIRWSDRREDFRTEVLGLMKAQNVKNTIIVPEGAKGGFFPKRLPAGGSRDDVQREVVASYQTFIRGLLDVTDNIGNARIVPPRELVRRDGDDAYLVVAADKGTATFSDVANSISAEYGFWLGDAFASGGSAGYDHKKMAITARGAWECVKRHFREIGVDIQSQDFSVAGIGDMSGDVFGNGMLLSKHIRLVAAFNHQHVFLDPNPRLAASFRERQRLFTLPRSTWEDYDRRLISKGGGVFPRSAKSITLSSDVQKVLGLVASSATPTDVVRAILSMPVDLLWNGGIGTYVKASAETHSEVGDRANDALRINGHELKAKVVGEGGNLGLTQRGRIEYAMTGGRINTDFIDNSAGVNTSDVEVNLKILCSALVRTKRMAVGERNRLLRSMTREVAALVLRNNYLQSQAISTLELTSGARLSEYQHLIRSLERTGELNRGIEFLPSDDEIGERRKAGTGLTRPELAIVLAYSKMWLRKHLIQSDVPEDPYLSAELQRYFPDAVRSRFPREIRQHRLRREIIVTATTNSLVNRMGPVFVLRAQEDTGADPAQIARAYTIARESFDMRQLWAGIESLDTRIPAAVQYGMMYRTSRLLRHSSYWLLARRRRELNVDKAVAVFRRGVQALDAAAGEIVAGADRARFEATRAEYLKVGVPAALAERVAGLDALESAFDLVELAAAHRAPVVDAARLYFEVGAQIGLDWLRQQIEKLQVDGPWQAVARTTLRDSALRVHRRLTERVLARRERGAAEARVRAWIESLGEQLAHWNRTISDMRTAGAGDFATLSVGVEAVRKLAD
ncbi:MAG: NAD-glutamate dehydrogenase [Gammaproteobacteria bacterium]